MIILWTLLLATTATSHKVVESTEDIGPEAFKNVTTLYPIAHNKTDVINNNTTKKEMINMKDVKEDKPKTGATIWKIETSYAESNLGKNLKGNTTVSITDSNETTDKNVNCAKEFKPSLHLGNIIDEDSAEMTPGTTFASFAPAIKKPASGFVSYPKNELNANFDKPKEIYDTQVRFPYKFESPIFTKARDNWRPDLLEPKPTVEVPVEVPAGGLYKFPDAFKGKPSFSQEDFGLEFNGDGGIKWNQVKKRVSPWQHLLRLMTSFIPVGLIISALTPSVITLQSTGNDNQFPSNFHRRSDGGIVNLAPISERCRRRLLCELHSEVNYSRSVSITGIDIRTWERVSDTVVTVYLTPTTKGFRGWSFIEVVTAQLSFSMATSAHPKRGKQCYRIRCEDTQALTRMLQWLITYHQPAGDQRARHFT